MAKKIDDIYQELTDMHHKLKQILNHAEFGKYYDLSGIEVNKEDPEQLFLKDELELVLNKIDYVCYTLDYLKRPIREEGVLHKNANGRYEINGVELTAGSGIEYLAADDKHGRYNENDDFIISPYWCSSRIEHNGTDYYIVGASDLDMENVRVRIRK